MRFPAREIRLKDGRICLLRPAVPEDAEEMLAYMRQTAGETPFLLRNPDEMTHTPESERAFLQEMLENPHAVMTTARVEGRLAGNSAVSGLGPKRKLRHRCSLAIALYRDWWGLGIGTALIGCQVELARQMGFSQMDLEVVADNARAVALYEKCGFTATGRRHDALLFDDGTYHDEIIMYRKL